MALPAYGFHFAYTMSGGPPRIIDIISADTALAVGDLVNCESGNADLAATNDGALIGAVVGTADPDADITALNGTSDKVRVISNRDAVYMVTDANARLLGATLDIAGTTGAQTLAASSNVDVVVVETSTASEPTAVMVAPGEHVFDQ